MDNELKEELNKIKDNQLSQYDVLNSIYDENVNFFKKYNETITENINDNIDDVDYSLYCFNILTLIFGFLIGYFLVKSFFDGYKI